MKKRLGLRYAMSTVPLDPSCVRGTHGRLSSSRRDGPMLVTSDAGLLPDAEALPAAGVRDLVLRGLGV